MGVIWIVMMNIELLRMNELRVLGFYRGYLIERYGDNAKKQFGLSDDANYIRNVIKNFISIKTRSERDGLIKDMNRDMNENIISTNELSWIFESFEMTSFMWGAVVLEKNEDDRSELKMNPMNIDFNTYIKMGLPLYVFHHEQRVKILIDYFDKQWFFSNKVSSMKLIDNLTMEWKIESKSVKEFKWLSIENKGSIDWALDYLKKYDDSERYNGSGINSLPIFNSVNLHEKKIDIYSILRLWRCHHSEKTLLISNMNKAWQQRKLRHERTTKKAINCYVDIEVKKKLDELVKDSGFQMNYILADLINRAHDIKFSKK